MMFHESRLASAVLAQQGEDFALVQSEVYVFVGDDSGEELGDPEDFEFGWGGSRSDWPRWSGKRSCTALRLVDFAFGGRGTHTTHEAGYGDDCDYVGQHRDELTGDLGDAGEQQLVLEGLGVAEQGRGAECAEGVPVSEDHGGQRDEAATRGHAFLELADCLENEEGSGKTGEHASQGGVYVAVAVDVNADGVGGAWMFTDSARAQTPAGIEQTEMHNHDHDQSKIGDGRIVKEDRSDYRDLGQSGNRDGGELAFGDGITVVQIGGGTKREDDDDGARDDLVHAKSD